jgi:hypothetical protein
VVIDPDTVAAVPGVAPDNGPAEKLKELAAVLIAFRAGNIVCLSFSLSFRFS